MLVIVAEQLIIAFIRQKCINRTSYNPKYNCEINRRKIEFNRFFLMESLLENNNNNNRNPFFRLNNVKLIKNKLLLFNID